MKINTPKSKYLEAFLELKNSHSDKYHLVSDTLLVEKIPTQELAHEVTGPGGKKSNIYLAGGEAKKIDGLDMNLPMFVRVLEVGPGFFTPGNEIVPLDVEPGDIILVGRMAVMWFSVFGSLISSAAHGEIGITRENEIKMRFKGQNAYDACFNHLNSYLLNHGQKEAL